ncbi:hypothetical protein ADL02_10860 [Streptomyces sp. NRRL WC-3723]|nr:hypothetical protein ADL02_10860 [Streptomyces sp. NRRL WC-3723]
MSRGAGLGEADGECARSDGRERAVSAGAVKASRAAVTSLRNRMRRPEAMGHLLFRARWTTAMPALPAPSSAGWSPASGGRRHPGALPVHTRAWPRLPCRVRT